MLAWLAWLELEFHSVVLPGETLSSLTILKPQFPQMQDLG